MPWVPFWPRPHLLPRKTDTSAVDTFTWVIVWIQIDRGFTIGPCAIEAKEEGRQDVAAAFPAARLESE